MNKSYSELVRFSNFLERFEYLRLLGSVGVETFGSHRYLNQRLYTSNEWRRFRKQVILRDDGCDLGIKDRPIGYGLIIHHLNPVTVDDIINRSDSLFDLENVVCVAPMTHRAIHYGDSSLLVLDPVDRRPNDTCPWLNRERFNND